MQRFLLVADWSLFGVSIYFYLVAISVPIMIIVYFTSRTDSPPVYHLIYAVHAIWICMVLIRMMASETSSLTYTIGMASQMSPTFIMVTLTTWEGGIGSLIANVALAYRGYQRMSFAACFGSPLFSILFKYSLKFQLKGMPVTFGARYLYRVLTSESGVAKVGQGPLGSTIHVILFTIIFFPLMGNLVARDKGRKSLGVYRLLFYPIFLLFALLAEFEIIHGHGTDHTDQRVKLN
ncbi:unnamed protein product [Hermetia illucens]|uniref:Sodium/calcium exchanger membrane region domain-containing protein n=1 Tax=Hermetia illucens TaxID=343691 RepID=A0A7R8UN08_HERIL|nr:unnamed protein product [Hermetia illucens]